MKTKLIPIIGITAALALTACSSGTASTTTQTITTTTASATETVTIQDSTTEDTQITETTVAETTGKNSSLNTVIYATIPEDALIAYQEAAGSIDEGLPDPVALLGSQIVAGVNYVFLSRDVALENYTISILYQNFNGDVEVTDTRDFDINELSTKSTVMGNIAGGWSVNGEYVIIDLPTELQPAYETFTQEHDEEYDVISYLGKINSEYAALVHITDYEQSTEIDATEDDMETLTGLGVILFNSDYSVKEIKYINLYEY